MLEFIDSLKWNKKIEVLRIAHGWTQKEAAEKCNSGQKTFWSWEKGQTYPQRNSRRTLAGVFGVCVESIFEEE